MCVVNSPSRERGDAVVGHDRFNGLGGERSAEQGVFGGAGDQPHPCAGVLHQRQVPLIRLLQNFRHYNVLKGVHISYQNIGLKTRGAKGYVGVFFWYMSWFEVYLKSN